MFTREGIGGKCGESVQEVKTVGRQRWRENILVVGNLGPMENSYDMINLIITIMMIMMIMMIIRIIIMMIIKYHLIAWQEESVVVLPFNKSVGSVAVRLTKLYMLIAAMETISQAKKMLFLRGFHYSYLHSGKSHFPSFILLGPYLLHYFHLQTTLSLLSLIIF